MYRNEWVQQQFSVSVVVFFRDFNLIYCPAKKNLTCDDTRKLVCIFTISSLPLSMAHAYIQSHNLSPLLVWEFGFSKRKVYG